LYASDRFQVALATIAAAATAVVPSTEARPIIYPPPYSSFPSVPSILLNRGEEAGSIYHPFNGFRLGSAGPRTAAADFLSSPAAGAEMSPWMSLMKL
jgi:hypothetical protein